MRAAAAPLAISATLAGAVAIAACRTVYPAPPPRPAPAPSVETPRAAPDQGDVARMTAEERTCRATLHGRAVAASLQAIDAATEALGAFCSLEPVEDDPLLWRVWCRADALFQSGHYLRANTDPFPCRGANAQSAFECAGRILAERLLVPGHAEGVELVAVGHVDRQRIAADSEFLRDPCLAQQQEMGLTGDRAWGAWAGPGAPPDLMTWNHRLAWCRAAYAAGQTLRGLRSVDSVRRLDMAVVGAGTSWLAARGACPGGSERGAPPGECAAARRVDVLVRIQPAERPVESACAPPAEIAGPANRALYCYEDCAIVRETGRVRQRYVPPRSGYVLFEGTGAATDPGWIVHRARGSTERMVNVPAVRGILGIPPAR